ncbi:MAG: hypothetical protein FRX48_03248 [Lasallia pustulata]|uniref:Uncharacterized protein n=1 Tax=Lasallia pustulata TaxID=136370 RepID=A0A5M8PV94_9LECA|nr:MAG: hypothetical protein FRX48_03248 [Lasallia pustulata]
MLALNRDSELSLDPLPYWAFEPDLQSVAHPTWLAERCPSGANLNEARIRVLDDACSKFSDDAFVLEDPVLGPYAVQGSWN